MKLMIGSQTAIKSIRIAGEMEANNTFQFQLDLKRCQEVVVMYLDRWLPIIACPGDHIHLKIEAKHWKNDQYPWSALEISGHRAQVNEHIWAFRQQFDRRFPEEVDLDEQISLDSFKRRSINQIEDQRTFLNDKSIQLNLNDTSYQYTYQYICCIPYRNIFRFLMHKRDTRLTYETVLTDYFDYWSNALKLDPDLVFTWHYQQMLSTWSNFTCYLNIKSSLSRKLTTLKQKN